MSITPADIATKKSELTGPGGIFELEDKPMRGRSYPIYKHAPKTVIDVLNASRGHGDQDFIVYEDQRYTFTRFFEAADAFAASLQIDYKIAKGDRVAIAMRNNPDWCIAYTAATLIGAIVVPINSWGKTEELHYAITDCKASVLVCDSARLKLLDSVFDSMDIQVIVSDTENKVAETDKIKNFAAVLDAGGGRQYEAPEIDPEDNLVILYTSGSTGFPKGVVHQHIALCQALMNVLFVGFLVRELEGDLELKGGAEREAPMLTVPLFHATGLLSGFYLPLQMGQKTVMMYKWDAEKALRLIQEEQVTGLASVPAIVQDLLNHPKFEEYNTGTLSRVTAAGAATPAGLPELIEAKIGKVSRGAGFGMTETVAVGSLMTGSIFDLKPNSAGIVSPIMQFRFKGADGQIVPQGESGEVQLYGVTCTAGYWEKPEANAKTFDADGWMDTGDVGYLDDDGFIHITGRIKEIVIRAGENIYPGEIEHVAYQLDAVHEVVVFGEPDEVNGEELVMVAYRLPGQALEESELRDYLKEKLAGYKVPRKILFSDTALPRNASEKLHKLKVKEAYLASQ